MAVLLHLRPLGALWVALALTAELVPVVVLSPVAGLLVDRLPNRQLLVAVLALAGAAIAATAWLALEPQRAGWLVAGLAVVGATTAVARPAIAAMIPAVSGEDGATRAYGYYAAVNQGGLLVGVAAGGLLVGLLGTRWALLLDAASFAAMALAVAALRSQRHVAAEGTTGTSASARPPADRRAWRGRGRGALAGFHLIGRDRLLRVSVAGLATVVLVSVVVNVAEVYFVVEDLGVGPAGFGLISACWPLAGIAGGWLGGRLVGDRALAFGLAGGGAAMGAAVATAALLSAVAPVAIAWAIAGAANTVQVVCIQSMVRSRTDDAHRGRAFAAMGAVLQSANVAGLAASTPALVLFGARTSLVFTGAVTVIVALSVGALSVNAIRHSRGGPSTSQAGRIGDTLPR